MLLLKFFHNEHLLYVGDKEYRATCDVRNEINKRRNKSQIVKTFPLGDSRQPYYPRKFPTGAWEIKKPIWTLDPEYAPVKIPTTAKRNVFIWSTKLGKYHKRQENVQEDSFYHLHFAEHSRTTIGCIRLHSEENAREIAELIEYYQNKGKKVYIEVFA